MAHQGTINWTGASGNTYTYEIHPIGTEFNAIPGNYIFAKQTVPNRWLPIYIGQTGDLSERFDDHHKMPCIRQNGGTHIHVHQSSSDEKVRMAEESDLVARWNPICNG